MSKRLSDDAWKATVEALEEDGVLMETSLLLILLRRCVLELLDAEAERQRLAQDAEAA